MRHVAQDLGHSRGHICGGKRCVVGCKHPVVEFSGDFTRQQEARDNHRKRKKGTSYYQQETVHQELSTFRSESSGARQE